MTVNDKIQAWKEKNNISTEDGTTYIITGDSYSIKDELKAAGWKFDSILKWHKADPAGYEDRVIKIKLTDLGGWSAWGEFYFNDNAEKIIQDKMDELLPPSKSVFLGEIGERLKDISCTFVRQSTFDTRFGLSHMYRFEDDKENVLIWFSTKELEFETGARVLLTGTVKNHDTYKNTKQTILTRCKIIEAK